MSDTWNHDRSRALILVTVFTVVAALPMADAALPALVDPMHEQKLQPAGPGSSMHGWSLASDGTTMVLGAPGDSTRELAGGSALVYEKVDGDWMERERLYPDDPQRSAQVGGVVAVSGPVIVVGSLFASQDGVRTGAAYVFEREGDGSWNQTAKLVPGHGLPFTGFARSAAVGPDTIMVGASGNAGGAVHLYTKIDGTWTEGDTLRPLDAATNPRFGTSIALDGDRLAVGASGARTDDVILAGAMYIFERQGNGTWMQVTRLVADDPAPVAGLGQRVDLDGDTAIAGAPLARNGDGHSTGAGYLFERGADGSWQQAAKMLPEGLPSPTELIIGETGAEPADSVGWDVAVEAGVAVLGSPNADDGGSSSPGANVGYAYAYVRTPVGWVEEARLMAFDAYEEGDGGDEFGFSVDVADGQVLVGARNDETETESFVGSVYVFPTIGLGAPLPPMLPIG